MIEIKTCNVCGKEYPATTEYFYKQTYSNRLFNQCKSCYRLNRDTKDVLMEINKSKKREERWKVESEQGRKCNRCKEVYPLTDEYFYKSKVHIFGLNTICKECMRKADKSRYRRRGNSKIPEAEREEFEEKAYKRLINEPQDFGIGDKLKELSLEKGKIYEIYIPSDLRRKSYVKEFEGTLIHDNKEHITLRHKLGYCESFRKCDILSGERKIKEVAR